MKIFKRIKNHLLFRVEQLEIAFLLLRISRYLSSKGVRVLYVELPTEKKLVGLTDFEKERIRDWSFDFNKYRDELPKLKRIYGDDITQEYILSIFDGGTVVQGKKRKVLLDFESPNQHIINGRRITIGQPKDYSNTLYTHGACTWRGTGVEDKDTIASLIQELVNERHPNSFRVINSAIGRASSLFDDYEVIKEQQYRKDDIVVLGSFGKTIGKLPSSLYKLLGIEFIETSKLFARPHNYGEWFNDDPLHTNKRGNKVLADYIFHYLDDLKWFDVKDKGVELNETKIKNITKGEKIYGDNPELLKYIDSIKTYKKGNASSRNGSIVMNCNPFTLGHRYLIEYAASKVDYLYIFVVEENKSFFPFEDRFRLVKNGTADLSNVIVLPSGNFIISAVTFPGYFYKDNLKETKIDCSNDLNVFAQYIAPTLNIKVRFAGEEPLDPVTKQYNEGMAEILPQHGMVFCEIPRKQDDEGVGVISASRVRKLLKEKDFDSLKKLVPQTTLDYLLTFEHDSNK